MRQTDVCRLHSTSGETDWFLERSRKCDKRYSWKRMGERRQISIARAVRSSPPKRSGMDHIVVTLQTHHTSLYFVRVHQTAPPLSSDSSHLIAAYYSFIDPQEDEKLSPTADGLPYKWLPINCRSGAGQRKFASQWPTFYHWSTPLIHHFQGLIPRETAGRVYGWVAVASKMLWSPVTPEIHAKPKMDDKSNKKIRLNPSVFNV